MTKLTPPRIDYLVDAGIDVACEMVGNLPLGQRTWDKKEYAIAETAARAGIDAIITMLREPDSKNVLAYPLAQLVAKETKCDCRGIGPNCSHSAHRYLRALADLLEARRG